MDLAGYPAVTHRRQGTDCHTSVGLSDSGLFFVWYRDWMGRPDVDTCGPATRIAAEVLATIQAAQ
ncbi:hypothetical protein Actkin_01219 [Actinokineospora sp. UTMC 2448]|nr:hypothetical protein Actkin_01219 [Actinokineospora sp. UTMC 2448]